MSNQRTMLYISPNPMRYSMNKYLTAAITLALVLQGCISTVDLTDPDGTESKDYPRLELPDRGRTSAVLENFDDCDRLLMTLQQNLLDEMVTTLDQHSYHHWVEPWFGFTDDVAFAEADGGSSATPTTGMARSDEFSGTNNQESGVDEADFLKTDGSHTYMLNGDLLLIFGIPEFGQIEMISTLEMEGTPLSMMIEGDTIVVASSVYGSDLDKDHPMRELLVREVSYEHDGQTYSYEYFRSSLVKYSVVDVQDKSSPVVDYDIYFEGYFNTARLVEGTVRSVTHYTPNIEGLDYYVDLPAEYWNLGDRAEKMEIWNQSLLETLSNNRDRIQSLTLEDFVPMRYVMTGEGAIATLPYSDDECGEYSASSDSVAQGFLTIATMDLSDEDLNMRVNHIGSSWAHVYSSQDALVFAEPANDWWWFWGNDDYEDATNIHVFDISDHGYTTYVASGRVLGTVQDQFSISEYEGVIRVASTTDAWGRWWIMDQIDPETGLSTFTGPSNRVTILNPDGSGNLDQIGLVDGIADGERIWSARFIGDRGYLVTFETIDPLWVLDLSDPYEPVILGELEVPGVSTYIHPVNENTLLTIGIGPGEDGLGLDWSTTQVSLFDVSDPTNPTLADSMKLTPAYSDSQCEDIRYCGWTWSWSEATYEHKAFTFWPPDSILAVPLSTYRYVYDEDGYSGYEYVSVLKMIDVDTENLSLGSHGEIDHSSFYNDENGDTTWWHSYSTSIRRSIFMGDFVYAFSALGISVHSTDNLSTTETLLIPGQENPFSQEMEESEEADSKDYDCEGSASDECQD